jgi:hypothetical protein
MAVNHYIGLKASEGLELGQVLSERPPTAPLSPTS